MDQRIKTFLLKKFPEKQTLREGELQYAEKTALLKKDLSAFGNWFPGMEFYTTKLQTAYFEFPEVEILVAVEPGAMSGIKILKSLSFEPPDASFLKLFYGCHVQTGKEQQQLAHAITKLLASVAVQPEIEMLSAANSPDVLYRISQANHGYIDFTYKFSQHKKLVEILIHGN